MEAAPKKTQAQVGRGAMLGLGLGALAGSLFLLYKVLMARFGQVDCAGLAEADCGIKRDTLLEMAHVEAQFAVALAALSLAAFLFFRSMRPEEKTP